MKQQIYAHRRQKFRSTLDAGLPNYRQEGKHTDKKGNIPTRKKNIPTRRKNNNKNYNYRYFNK